jgi:hypothetical protein
MQKRSRKSFPCHTFLIFQFPVPFGCGLYLERGKESERTPFNFSAPLIAISELDRYHLRSFISSTTSSLLHFLNLLYFYLFPLQYLSADSQPPELPAIHSTEGE